MSRIYLYSLLIIFFNSNLFANKDSSLDKVSILLQWKHQFQFAGYYMAKEKGFYKDVGLDVDIREFNFGLDVATEVKEERVNFAVGKSTLLINSSNGDDIVLLAAIYQSSPHILFALKDNGINSIKDFKNKRIMMTGDAKSDATFMSMLFSHQVRADEFQRQEHSFNLKDLVDKKTDLMASYISNEPYRLKEEYGLEGIVFDPKDHGFDVYNDILFTSMNELETNPQRVENFRSASLKGWEYAFSNIEETVDIILSKYNTQNKSKDALLFEGRELKKLAYYKTNHLGEISKEKVGKIFHTYKVLGLTQNEIDLNELIYDENHFLLSKEEKEYLKQKGDLQLCVPKMMPYMMVDSSGNHLGISKDIFNIFNEKLNLDINVTDTNSKKETLAAVNSGLCDIIPLAYKSKIGEKYLNYTNAFLEVPYALATRVDVTFVNSLNQIEKGKIAYLDDCYFATLVQRKYTHLEFVPVKSIDEGMKKILSGEVFGLFITLEELAYGFPPEYSQSIKIGGKLDEKLSFSVGINKEEELLLSIFNKLVNTITEDKKQEILNKYMSIKYEEKIDFEALLEVIMIFTIVLLILIYFLMKQQRLKKEIESLNKELSIRIKNEVEKNRQKDKALYKQARLASLGEMIGNIAHQWRQPLNRINLSSQGIKFLLDEDNIENPEVNKRIRNIEKNINYMSDTIDDFRSFFHPAKLAENFDIHETLLKAFKLLDKRVCDLSINLPKSEGIKVRGYQNEFLQVVLVILNNALDNFEKTSVLKKRLKVKIKKDERFTILSIEDNSGGINEEIIDKIFDPYFTTKFKEEGSGIGLYMAKMIIEKSMDGKLEVESHNGSTTFFISIENKGK